MEYDGWSFLMMLCLEKSTLVDLIKISSEHYREENKDQLDNSPTMSIHTITEWNSFGMSVEDISVADDCCNEVFFWYLHIEYFNELKTVTIGNHCFDFIEKVVIGFLPKLASFRVGERCFAGKQFDRLRIGGNMLLHDCLELQEIVIGNRSFCNFYSCTLESISFSLVFIFRITQFGIPSIWSS